MVIRGQGGHRTDGIPLVRVSIEGLIAPCPASPLSLNRYVCLMNTKSLLNKYFLLKKYVFWIVFWHWEKSKQKNHDLDAYGKILLVLCLHKRLGEACG
jgi:hypothetical protein